MITKKQHGVKMKQKSSTLGLEAAAVLTTVYRYDRLLGRKKRKEEKVIN